MDVSVYEAALQVTEEKKWHKETPVLLSLKTFRLFIKFCGKLQYNPHFLGTIFVLHSSKYGIYCFRRKSNAAKVITSQTIYCTTRSYCYCYR